MKKIRYILLTIALILTACRDNSSSSTITTISSEDYTVTVSGSSFDNSSIYAVLTNENYTMNSSSQILISGSTSSKSVNEVSTNESIAEDYTDEGFYMGLPVNFPLLISNDSLDKSASGESIISGNTISVSEIVGTTTKDFIVYNNSNGHFYKSTDTTTSTSTVTSTLRKSLDISTNFGNKTIKIWVADSEWNTGKRPVTQAMVDGVSDKFLLTGSYNDIYDWVTNIYGEEWGSVESKDSNLLNETDEINILIYPIDTIDSTPSGYIGYFASKDNYDSYKEDGVEISNGKIMFYMSSEFLAYDDGDWAITDEYPELLISTLAHEFLHMIMFYQKSITYGSQPTDWLNEMCAMVTEDFVSDKLGITGPRGIVGTDYSAGSSNISNKTNRMNGFNGYNWYPINEWSGSTPHYSVKYGYGAFLARNFGGTDFFKKVVQSSYTDVDAVEYALDQMGYSSVSFVDTLKYWGEAVVLSTDSAANISYKLNNGLTGFDAENGYKLGSINVDNYSTLFTYYGLQDTDAPTLQKGANMYYKLGTGITGSSTWNMQIPGGVSYQLIVKNSDGSYNESKTTQLNNSAIKVID